MKNFYTYNKIYFLFLYFYNSSSFCIQKFFLILLLFQNSRKFLDLAILPNFACNIKVKLWSNNLIDLNHLVYLLSQLTSKNNIIISNYIISYKLLAKYNITKFLNI